MSAHDDLHASLHKAHALALVTYGESGGDFRNMSDDVQDCYMRALSDLLREAVRALERLDAEKPQGGCL